MIKVRKSGYILREREPPPGAPGRDCAEPEHLRRLYTKSGTPEPPEIIGSEDLLRAVQAVNDAFIEYHTSNPEIPQDMKKRFENELRKVAGAATGESTEQYIRALEEGEEIEAALEAVMPALRRGEERMLALATEFELELATYLLMKRNEEFGYSWYLFICENGDNTCTECSTRHRRIYSLEDFEKEAVIRGLHPNCRCRIIQMNRETANGFLGSDKYMGELEELLDRELGDRGGVYLLPYVDFYYISTGSTIMEISPEYAPSKFGQFFIDAKAFWDAFVANHHSYGYKGGLEGFSDGEFVRWLIEDSINFLLLGIPGAFYDGIKARVDAMFENPSFYTIVNNFSYGILEMVVGAVNPEEPFSFQHIMDVLGTLFIGYGAYKGVETAIARSQPPRLPSTGPAYIPPGLGVVDDVARAAGTLDDILDDMLDDIARQGDDAARAGNGGGGKLTGKLDGLTQAERGMVDDLLNQGKNVEIIPKDPAAILKTPDFMINGISTELKTIANPNINTVITKIQNGFQQNAHRVLIDARNSGLTAQQAQEVIIRTVGSYKNKIPGEIEIWYNGGIITYP